MAGSGRGSLRPYQPSKGHNFLVIGLLLVVMVLSYNYWNVSVTKNEQTYEIASLQSSIHKLRVADNNLKVCYIVAVATILEPDVKFQSFHVGKSYLNVTTKQNVLLGSLSLICMGMMLQRW